VAPFLISGRVRLRTSNPVRRAQPRSGMPGREAPIPPSPPAKQKAPLAGPFRLQHRDQYLRHTEWLDSTGSTSLLRGKTTREVYP
jgi:hypothetical protein